MTDGELISHYRVIEKLGAGGMGSVWKAEDVHMQRVVALKFLHPGQDTARLLREAQTAGSLNHPNICTVYEVDPERAFLAMEFVEGRTLKDIIGGRPVPVNEALRLAVQTGEGLKSAHEKDITHRDIKPANIMVTPQGVVKIMDFGLARILGQAGLTLDGAAAGTPGYMAPEQMRGEPVDRRTDIWAYGAVLHEMLTGRPPTGQTEALPEGLGRIVRKSLAADPEERYQHIEDLLVDLRRAAGAEPPKSNRRVWLWTAGGATAAAAAVSAVLLRQKFAGRSYSSLAVLPLANLSGDAEQEWFSDGMTDTLISELSKIRALRVISRTSVMQYKKQPKPLKEVANELDVQAVVEGSALRQGDRVRVKASLIDALADRQLWGDEYERDMKDVFSLHREVAVSIAGEVKAALTPGEKQELAPARAVSPEAMEAFLKSGHFMSRGPKFFQAAIEEARKAVKLAPDFAQAHWALARDLQNAGDFGFRPYPEVLPEARAEIRRALELDPNLAQAHAFLGWTYFIADHNWEEAEPWLQKAFVRVPALIGSQYGMFLAARGRYDEAIAAGRKAVESDPLNPWALANLGRCYHHARKYEEAAAWARKALALDGEFTYAIGVLGSSLFQQGKLTEAFEYDIRGRLNAGLEGELRAAFQSGGWDAAWRLRWSKVESSSLSTQEKIRLRMQTGIRLRDGNQITEAVELMEKDGDAWLAQLQDPLLDPARNNPRFKAILKRLRYPESMWK